jgi:sulfite dehydrogenase (quinone) subunit SoeC
MNPAMSVVIFTTVIGAAQGLIVALALAALADLPIQADFLSKALLVAESLLVVGLGASFAHLGRPARAWRAVLMWRTSWLSREVIVLPAFIGLVGLWWLALRSASPWAAWLPWLAIPVAALLWYCTAMIYACLRFIEEWAQPLTRVNFTLIGLSSGCVLASALAASAGERALLAAFAPAAVAFTIAAALGRLASLRHNARLVPRSTLQSATGLHHPRLVQTSMGMSAGSFNTREFFHGVTQRALRQVKTGFVLFAFMLPLGLMAWALARPDAVSALVWLATLAVQAPGLLGERWFFFAQARHPQNLYYQVVS